MRFLNTIISEDEINLLKMLCELYDIDMCAAVIIDLNSACVFRTEVFQPHPL